MSYLYNTPAYNKHKETLTGKRNPIINTECDIELVNRDNFIEFDDQEVFRELYLFLEGQTSDPQQASCSDGSSSDGMNKRKWSEEHFTLGSSLDNSAQCPKHLNELKRPKKESTKIKNRIPDDDIRRRLAPIFADAFNKCDASIFSRILSKYSIPDCVVIYKYAGSDVNPYGPNYAEIVGSEAVVAFWDMLFCSIPDAIFELHETKIRLLSTDFCSIGCKFVFTGTKLFRTSFDGHEAVKYTHSSQCPAATTSGTNSETCPLAVPPVEAEVSNAVSMQDFSLGAAQQSQDVTLVGTLTFFVNPDKLIYKFEFTFCVKQ